jgi:hypothetical protein
LNLHKRFLTGGFLQTAVSNAPRTTSGTYLPTFLEWGASDTALAFLEVSWLATIRIFLKEETRHFGAVANQSTLA